MARASTFWMRSPLGGSDKMELREVHRRHRKRVLCRDEKFAVAHDLFFTVGGFEPDVEAEADDINVRAGTPGGAGVFAVGIAEGDVDAGKFFVLEDVADDAG